MKKQKRKFKFRTWKKKSWHQKFIEFIFGQSKKTTDELDKRCEEMNEWEHAHKIFEREDKKTGLINKDGSEILKGNIVECKNGKTTVLSREEIKYI